MIEVWMGSIEKLREEGVYQSCFSKLQPWRKEKALAYKKEINRLQSVAVWRLWQKIRERKKLPEDASFNLSHSGDYVLCAYSTEKERVLGCDIQVMKSYPERILKEVLCAEEQEEMKFLSQEEKKERFYRYWVLKESFAKATKKGLSIGLSKIGVCWKEGIPYYFRQPEGYGRPYICREFEVPKGDARIGVCSNGEEISKTLYEINTFL